MGRVEEGVLTVDADVWNPLLPYGIGLDFSVWNNSKDGGGPGPPTKV